MLGSILTLPVLDDNRVNHCHGYFTRMLQSSGVTRGGGGPPRGHHPGGWHPNKIIFCGWIL